MPTSAALPKPDPRLCPVDEAMLLAAVHAARRLRHTLTIRDVIRHYRGPKRAEVALWKSAHRLRLAGLWKCAEPHRRGTWWPTERGVALAGRLDAKGAKP